uniref:C2H2-type domain-containing protein n=1 Tax=Globodera pallida TaxID=36090 RepID=A0A183CFE0_GLOPA
MVPADADGTGADDCSGVECQSSGTQSPILAHESTAGTNALAAAACKALLFGQMDNKILAKALLSSSRTANAYGTSGQKDTTSAALTNQQQAQATNDEIMRILQQVSSMTEQQQHQAAHDSDQQPQNVSMVGGSTSSSSKLATQCQLCGKHFRKPRDLIAHLASSAHKFPASTPPTTASWPTGSNSSNNLKDYNNSVNNSFNPLLLLPSSNGTPQTTLAVDASPINIPQQHQQDVIGQFLKDMSPTALATPLTAATRNKSGDGGHQQSQNLVVNELRELRNTVAELRTSTGSSNKLEQMLGQLDSRVCRLEKQLDMALNSIYTLVQLQTGINNSVQKLASATTKFKLRSFFGLVGLFDRFLMVQTSFYKSRMTV